LNEVASELVRAASDHFGKDLFVVQPNDGDPQAEPGSVVLVSVHPTRAEHRAAISQRGNAFEVMYSDGRPPGPAEALFVFDDGAERRGAIESSLTFLNDLFTRRVVAYRERIGAVAALLRGDNCTSLLRFGTAAEVAARSPQQIEVVYHWP
jgi:hypothetical protein